MVTNKKTLRAKNVLGIFLALLMVITLVPVTNLKAFAASNVTVKMYFMNSWGWDNVYMYAWSGISTSSWPGDNITDNRNGAGYYVYETTVNSSNPIDFQFNYGDNGKTPDLSISSSTLASDEDGYLEVWVNCAGNLSYSAPAGGPQMNGNQATFTYQGSSGKSVYLAGTMNGWSTTANPMTWNGSAYTCTVTLDPGLYEYKFVVDGEWINDTANGYATGKDSNSAAVITGLLPATIGVKKGGNVILPDELTFLGKTGETNMAVTYSSKTAGVTVDGYTVELSDSFTGDSFTLTATGTDSSTATVTVKFYESDDITVKIHYDRTDNKESEWNAWVWGDRLTSKGYDFVYVNGEYIATCVIPIEDAPYVNLLRFKNRKGEWKAEEGERQVDLKNVLSGDVHVYVKADGSYSVDYSEAVTGLKLNSIKYDRDNNKIVIQASDVIPSPADTISIEKTDGSTIGITDVEKLGNKYTLSINEDLTSLVKVCSTYFLIYDGNKYLVTMPNVYKTEEFETEYTYDGNDLGATWSEDSTTFRVWAPTAESVDVCLYADGESTRCIDDFPMTKDVKGTWIAVLEGDWEGVYYTYEVNVNGETVEACDPYARTTGVNGKYAMVIDLDSTDPEGWEDDISPNSGMTYTDSIIYELHVRDLSINEESGIREEWRGKFLGLTQKGTTNKDGVPTGLDHIRNLGVTHVHLLPSYDFGSIDETMSEEDKAANPEKQFNWGYDPVNYNVPEGSYSTNPYDGAVRVKEMKEMVQTLHENNINVIMDVVYNHVHDAGSFGFNMIVPKYFSRTNADGTYSNGSGCGNDTASERSMVRKYIVDSVKYWADEYHIDGFRFDLVGLLDAETINTIVDEVHKTHPDVVFYGEGWTMGTAVEPADTIMATQQNASHTPNFAYFSDTFRDFLKGNNDETTWGFVQGATEGNQEGTLIECFMANTGWIGNPTQVINYASCHDNYTLMDKINATRKDLGLADRIKMNNLAAAIYMTAEGIPLIHAGEEILRTKVDSEGNIIHNSYNVPDYVNSLKWGDLDDAAYQGARDYYAGLIEFRKNHAALRLTTKTEVNNNVTAEYVEDNVVMFKINGHDNIAAEVSDEIVIVFNANSTSKTFSIYEKGASTGTWNICVNDQKAGTTVLDTVTNGSVTVAPYSALMLVKGATVDANSIYNKVAVEETGRITVEYVDQNGNMLDWYSLSGKVGSSYSTQAREFDGYVLSKTATNASGKYTSADIFVKYVYGDASSLQGLNQAPDGKWYYYKNGIVDTTFTGMAKKADGVWYVKAGVLDTTFTGMAKNAYGVWYMKNGKLDTTYTGLAKNAYGVWYMKDGKLDTTFTGMVKNAYGIWYVNKGKVDTTYTGMATYNGLLIYVKAGKFDATFTGFAKNSSGTWYLKKGIVDTKYTGMAKNAYGVWYVNKGKLDTTFTGMVVYGGKCCYVNKGKLDLTYTGLAKNAKGVWYMKNGVLDLTYTGMAKNAYGVWYMKNGKLDTTFTGLVMYGGKCCYVNKGKLDLTYTGLAKNASGIWYMNKGILDLTYNGKAVYQGVTYNVVNGKAVN